MDFPCIGRSRRLWRRLFLAAYALLLLGGSLTWICAEWLHGTAQFQGPPAAVMAQFQAAARLFPFDFQMRAAPAKFCAEIRWKGSGPDCIAALRRELAFDPMAHDLRRAIAGFLIGAGREDEAKREIATIHAFAPHLPIIVPVNISPETR